MIKIKRGFTMIEMLVVFILIAILAQIAIVTYRNSVQDSKRDHAKALLQAVAVAAQRFYTDFPAAKINSGKLTTDSNPAAGAACNVKKYGDNPFNILIACGYLEAKNWDEYDYEFFVCGLGADPKDNSVCGTNKDMGDGSPQILAAMRAGSGAGKYFHMGGNGTPDICFYNVNTGLNSCN